MGKPLSAAACSVLHTREEHTMQYSYHAPSLSVGVAVKIHVEKCAPCLSKYIAVPVEEYKQGMLHVFLHAPTPIMISTLCRILTTNALLLVCKGIP